MIFQALEFNPFSFGKGGIRLSFSLFHKIGGKKERESIAHRKSRFAEGLCDRRTFMGCQCIDQSRFTSARHPSSLLAYQIKQELHSMHTAFSYTCTVCVQCVK
jgi:hypothetical protein